MFNLLSAGTNLPSPYTPLYRAEDTADEKYINNS
jgi:hypothetical protein